ncbi:MAG TPA: hypothetical protein VIY51_01680, partial [Xanthobacteraceae bacterium]
LLTSDATSLSDPYNIIPMATLRTMFQEVVDTGFDVLALINACYSGAFAQRPFGQNNAGYVPRNPGAHAILAGGTGELTWHKGEVGSGSVFFEKFFAALDGHAGNGSTITVHELAAYLQREVSLATNQGQNPLSYDISRNGSAGYPSDSGRLAG